MAATKIEDFVGGFPRAGGFVYILTSEAHPHLLKIGFTTRSPADRATELDATGSPHPFAVAFALYHPEPHSAEQRLHAAMSAQRVRAEREFFALPIQDAVAVIMREFGEDAPHFDPLAITETGKARLAQMQREAESDKIIIDRAVRAGEHFNAMIKKQRVLAERLAEAERQPKQLLPSGLLHRLFGKTPPVVKSEVEELRAQVAEVEALLEAAQKEYREAEDESNVSGASARHWAELRREMESRSSRWASKSRSRKT